MAHFSIASPFLCARLLIAQALVTFNDNAAKLMLFGLGTIIFSSEMAATASNLIVFLLIVPFIILAPVTGWIADRFSKSSIFKIALFAQLGCLALIAWSLYSRQFYGALGGFTLLAVQSAFLFPAKKGILKEVVGPKHLAVAIGWMELLGVLAILSGSVAGGYFFDHGMLYYDDPWSSALMVVSFIGLSAAFSFLIVLRSAVATPVQTREPFRLKIIASHFHDLASLWRRPLIRAAALGIAWYYMIGGFLLLTLMQLSRELQSAQEPGAASTTGLFLLTMGGGLVIGSLTAAYLNRFRIEMECVLLGMLFMIIDAIVLGLVYPFTGMFFMGLFGVGLGGGLFLVPLQAILQGASEDNRRGRNLAASSLLNSLGGIVAVGAQWIVGRHFSAAEQFLLISVILVVVNFYLILLLPDLLRLVVKAIVPFIYRIKILGREHIPKEGGVLLISNHPSYIDPLLIRISLSRPVRFLAYTGYAEKSSFLRFIFRKEQVIPLLPKNPRKTINQMVTCLKAGEVVCLFPEGGVSRSGRLEPLKRGFVMIAKQAQVPVVPVVLEGLWGSIFSFSQGRLFRKKPKSIPYPFTIAFGKPMPFEGLDAISVHQVLMELAEYAFGQQQRLCGHLADCGVRALAKRPRRTLVIDHTMETPRSLSAGMLLTLSYALARKWRTGLSDQRIGIALPPGIGAFIANFAVVLAGKIPVNLNLTLSREAAHSTVKRAGLSTIVTAPAVRKRFPGFAWTPQIWDITQELKTLPRPYLLLLRGAISLLPGAVLSRLFRAPRHGDRKEAVLLFTSGSSGDPKGVILSHRNLLANLIQIDDFGMFAHDETLLASLPIFHSFGLTVGLWYPILYGLKTVTTPSPLEPRKIAKAIESEGATFLMGTPTFFRPYFKKVKPEALRSLRYVVAGSEKTPEGFDVAWEDQFKSNYLEGYGLTETSPVVSCNLVSEKGFRRGSVGRLVPGMAARICDPETGALLPQESVGLLYLKGANIFQGYLDDTRSTEAALGTGWFRTGDLARFDADGFLYIEGRLSRFSKIGGEMVPHGAIESAITEAYGLQQSEDLSIAVTSRPDPNKGESLVLLTVFDLDAEDLRAKLRAAGLPNLWIPREIRQISAIPTLPTGKLDLRACRAQAEA